jgi:hypothetical protein
MQTSRESITLSGTQVPLLREEQLRPGVLLTGVAMTHVWEIVGVERNQLFIRKLPATKVPCAAGAHVFAVYGRGHVCSACEVRKQAISEFMPKREDKARVHLITPNAAVQAPQPYTVYGYLLPDGTVKTVHKDGDTWDHPLPVIPTLSIVWTIPESLRSLISNPVTSSDPLEF